jgi:uroporphyrin-III C-methyltransferase/precorrin-2 dehydrogenase/sirohydrochlorin ferrochelatase
VLDDLPALAAQVETGPAILIIGDVVARSAPWRNVNSEDIVSELLRAAE